jgi:glutamyl-tRNA synthetase
MEFREFLRSQGYHHDMVDLEVLVGMVKERVSFVKEIWAETEFFFRAPAAYDREVIKKRWKQETSGQLLELKELLEKASDFAPEPLEQAIKSWIDEKGYNTGAVMNAFRLVIVGASRGPHMFDIISWLGKTETLARIEKGVSVIRSQA